MQTKSNFFVFMFWRIVLLTVQTVGLRPDNIYIYIQWI